MDVQVVMVGGRGKLIKWVKLYSRYSLLKYSNNLQVVMTYHGVQFEEAGLLDVLLSPEQFVLTQPISIRDDASSTCS